MPAILQINLQSYIKEHGHRQAIKDLKMNWDSIKEILETGECSAIRKVKGIADFLDLSCDTICNRGQGGSRLMQITIRELLGNEIPKRDIADGMEIDIQTFRKIKNTGTCAFIEKVKTIARVLDLTPNQVCGVGEAKKEK
jgi:hypothetical protein